MFHHHKVVFFYIACFISPNMQTFQKSEAEEWKNLKASLPNFSEESEQEPKNL